MSNKIQLLHVVVCVHRVRFGFFITSRDFCDKKMNFY